jgi:hypothetical protein
MNLFYNPSITELRQLVDSANNTVDKHNVVIDFDGEVIIDPEMKYKGIPLNKFKFHTTVTESVKHNARSLKALFETLVEAYQRNSNAIDFQRKFNRAA